VSRKSLVWNIMIENNGWPGSAIVTMIEEKLEQSIKKKMHTLFLDYNFLLEILIF